MLKHIVLWKLKGEVDGLEKSAVAEKIKALYPDDKGVGYELGQIRGAITIRKAM